MNNSKIISFCVPGMGFDGNTYKEKSLGGSETAALFLSRALAKMGHFVYVFTNINEQVTIDDVIYRPISMWKEFVCTTPHDVTIAQRLPNMLAVKTEAKLNLLWLHDLVSEEDISSYKGVAWNVDKILTVSNYHRNQAIDTLGFSENLIESTRNGIEPEVVQEAKKDIDGRDYKKMVFSARPERGLDVLLEEVFPRVLERDPDAWLCITGYENPVSDLQDFYSYIDSLAEKYGDKVQWKKDLNKYELYQEYLTAGCYLYPTPSPRMDYFREVSCISIMEAMACGLPIVSYNGGALPETMSEEAGVLIDNKPIDNPDIYAEVACQFINNEDLFKNASEAGRFYSKRLSWGSIATEWDELVDRMIAERNDDPDRLVRYFLKRSNIQPAKEVSQRNGLGFDFSDWEYNLKDHYETFPEADDNIEEVGEDGRLYLIKQFLPESGHFLDFGFGNGIYSCELAKESLGRTISGVDISEENVKLAQKIVRNYPKDLQDRVSFKQGDENSLEDNKYDVALLGEILEHQPNPSGVLNRVERSVVTGGTILFTVPYGPWEFGNDDNHHLWEIDPHSIWEMVGHKPNLIVGYQHCGSNASLGDPVGYHVVSYEVDGSEVKPIDMDRMINNQVPRQTVSGCIMAGPGAEKTLRWHLDSYAHLMDQIVVADTGMNGEARRIFQEYGAEFVEAPSPKEYGFEVPRNTALQFCNKDWVFWMDTDECLVDYDNLPKYLRENSYQGFGIHQHHFAVDTQFNPDMPVRLFRKRPYDGEKIRWYGMIHEHPEINLNDGPGPVVVAADLNIAHLGYLDEDIRRKRFWRNYPLLEKDIDTYPDRVLQKHFICRDSVLLASYILEQNGGVVDDKVHELCEKAVNTFRQYFLAQNGFANVNTQQYYQTALEILDTGIVVGPEFGFPENTRFATRGDLETVMKGSLDARLGEEEE